MAFVVPWVETQVELVNSVYGVGTILDIAPPPVWALWWRLGLVFILDIAPPLAWGSWWRLGCDQDIAPPLAWGLWWRLGFCYGALERGPLSAVADIGIRITYLQRHLLSLGYFLAVAMCCSTQWPSPR